MVYAFFLIFGCPLCGNKHPPRIHSYPRRRTQTGNQSYQVIRVVTVVCVNRQINGEHPNTKRFLPPSLIPRSPLNCAGLLELLNSGPDKYRISVDEACAALGCIDPRTARKHIRYVRQSTQDKLGWLAHALSVTKGVPFVAPASNSLFRLSVFWTVFLETVTGLFGASVSRAVGPLLRLTPDFSNLHISTGRAFLPTETRDTS
jgi:hypothetical protein